MTTIDPVAFEYRGIRRRRRRFERIPARYVRLRIATVLMLAYLLGDLAWALRSGSTAEAYFGRFLLIGCVLSLMVTRPARRRYRYRKAAP